jgi:hypothetical protein
MPEPRQVCQRSWPARSDLVDRHVVAALAHACGDTMDGLIEGAKSDVHEQHLESLPQGARTMGLYFSVLRTVSMTNE